MNAVLSETRHLLSVVPVSENCPCRLHFSVAIHSHLWAKVVLKDSHSEHPGTSSRRRVPRLESASVSALENLQNWSPPCLLSATPPAPPSLLISALLHCRLVLQVCGLDGFPSLPHTSSFFVPMREECAAQFLVVKFATLSSGQTSPYCGSYATLCWFFFSFLFFYLCVCVDLSNVKIKFKEWVCLVPWCHLSKFEVSFTKQLSNFYWKLYK